MSVKDAKYLNHTYNLLSCNSVDAISIHGSSGEGRKQRIPIYQYWFLNPQVYPKLNTNPAGYVNQVNSFGVNLLKMKVFLLC